MHGPRPGVGANPPIGKWGIPCAGQQDDHLWRRSQANGGRGDLGYRSRIGRSELWSRGLSERLVSPVNVGDRGSDPAHRCGSCHGCSHRVALVIAEMVAHLHLPRRLQPRLVGWPHKPLGPTIPMPFSRARATSCPATPCSSKAGSTESSPAAWLTRRRSCQSWSAFFGFQTSQFRRLADRP